MDRDENGKPCTSNNRCRHCGDGFLTLADEEHDECPDCIIKEIE